MVLPPTLDLAPSFPRAPDAPPAPAGDVIRHLRQRQLAPDVAAVLRTLYLQPRQPGQQPPDLERLHRDAAEVAAAAAAAAAGEERARAEAAAAAAASERLRQEGGAASGKSPRAPRQPLIPVAKGRARAGQEAAAAGGGAGAAAGGSPAGTLGLSSQHLRALVQQNLVALPQDGAAARCRAAGSAREAAAAAAAAASAASAAAAASEGPSYISTMVDEHTEILDYTRPRSRPQPQPEPAAPSAASSASLLGFWPEQSYLNHSCLPSAVVVPLGDRLLVRAVRELGPSEEVTISYLAPREQLEGLEARQRLLQERYGFACRCVRARTPPARRAPPLGSSTAQGLVLGRAAWPHLHRSQSPATPGRQPSPAPNTHAHPPTASSSSPPTPCTRCPRCRYERDLSGTLQPLVSELQAALPELRAEVDVAEAGGELAALLAADAQLQGLASTLQQQMAALCVEGAAAEVQKAPLLELYLLAHRVKAAMDPGTFRALSAFADCLQVVYHTAPGTELHTHMAAELAYRVERRYGPSSARTQEARALCFEAHRLRYGPLDVGTMKAVVKASAECAAQAGWW